MVDRLSARRWEKAAANRGVCPELVEGPLFFWPEVVETHHARIELRVLVLHDGRHITGGPLAARDTPRAYLEFGDLPLGGDHAPFCCVARLAQGNSRGRLLASSAL